MRDFGGKKEVVVGVCVCVWWGVKGLFVLVTWLSSVFRELPALLNWRGIHLEGPAAPSEGTVAVEHFIIFSLQAEKTKFS